jgi:hypothetical protein
MTTAATAPNLRTMRIMAPANIAGVAGTGDCVARSYGLPRTD